MKARIFILFKNRIPCLFFILLMYFRFSTDSGKENDVRFFILEIYTYAKKRQTSGMNTQCKKHQCTFIHHFLARIRFMVLIQSFFNFELKYFTQEINIGYLSSTVHDNYTNTSRLGK